MYLRGIQENVREGGCSRPVCVVCSRLRDCSVIFVRKDFYG